ncbi:Glycoside hydrolase family 38, N-terminal domain [Dillenia turbinata]|uniref:Glycoside hydrolase family 38, N-terminal domain n=1 Tax=Dillenia turbinata TaxID=194707 RepID=A0AAN8V143_9MAGN
MVYFQNLNTGLEDNGGSQEKATIEAEFLMRGILAPFPISDLKFFGNHSSGDIAGRDNSALLGERNGERTNAATGVANGDPRKRPLILQHLDGILDGLGVTQPDVQLHPVHVIRLPYCFTTSLSSPPTSSACSFLLFSGSASDRTAARAATDPPPITARVVPSIGPKTSAAAVARGGTARASVKSGRRSSSGWIRPDRPENSAELDNNDLFDYNVQERVNDFVAAAVSQANITRTNHIMWTMGTDLKYQYAHTWSWNMDKLIHCVNQDGHVDALYSTPSIYTDAKYATNESWPLKMGDFFPRKSGPTTKSLAGSLVIAQHHDAVSGTEKQLVADDYAKRLSMGYKEGPLLDEVHQSFNSWILHVGPIPIDDRIGKEVVTKKRKTMKNNKTFFADSSGHDFIERSRLGPASEPTCCRKLLLGTEMLRSFSPARQGSLVGRLFNGRTS